MGNPKHDLPLETLAAICKRYQVRELSLFGSALREDFGTKSDLDFLVEFEPEARIGFLALARMQRELSSALKRKVDLVPKDGLKPSIRSEVLTQAEVIYAA